MIRTSEKISIRLFDCEILRETVFPEVVALPSRMVIVRKRKQGKEKRTDDIKWLI